MAGGKGKSTGGKAGPKDTATKSQKSHSAKAGLQVSQEPSMLSTVMFLHHGASYTESEALKTARPVNNNSDESN